MMKLIEKANEFLRLLNELAASKGYDSYADAFAICEKLSVTDMGEVRHIVKLLENRGLVRPIWTARGISVTLSEDGIIFVESGYALDSVTQHDAPLSLHIDQSTIVHGGIQNSNVAVHSDRTSQRLSDNRAYLQVLDEVERVIENDQTLSDAEKSDHMADVENLRRELNKNKPKKANVHTYIASLGGIASIGSLIGQLVQLLPAMF